jgi:hypothetical protein
VTERRVIFPPEDTWTRNHTLKEHTMTDRTDDTEALHRDVASTALDLLEAARQGHHNGFDTDEAWEQFQDYDPRTLLGAMVWLIEAAIAIGADPTIPHAFDKRTAVVRGAIMDVLAKGSEK